MRKIRCLFSAALLAVAATVAVPALAAESPAGPTTWSAWWQELSVWIERLSPFGGSTVTTTDDDEATTPTDAETPPSDDGTGGMVIEMFGGGGDHDDTGPGWDPNG